jgi:ribosomal protein S18 acetylase RimI-like enzyme
VQGQGLQIRRLTELDAEVLRALRLSAVETEPQIFAESLDELLQMSTDTYAEKLRSGGNENFVFGAFENYALVGMAGFYREKRPKLRHKGWVWGIFVSPQLRGKGAGKSLLNSVVESARTLPELDCILLKVATTQNAAKKLYLSLGFRPFGVEARALKIGDAYIAEEQMVLELHQS